MVPSQQEPVTALRGARVEADARSVGRALAGASLVALVVLVIALVLFGVDKNARISSLRGQGVPVQVKVSGCLGLMGGSGSNLAGYACRGTFVLGGRRYDEAIPGDKLYPPGATVRAIAVPSDPGLLTTAGQLATERPSIGVFVLPAALSVVLALVVAGLVLRSRHTGGSRAPSPQL